MKNFVVSRSSRKVNCQLIIYFIFMFVCFYPVSVRSSDSEENKRILLFVSIEPQAYFVERIAGELVDVEVLVPPGKSPATFAPTPSLMVKLSKAKLFFSIGVPFEQAVIPKIKNFSTDLCIVDTAKGIELMPFNPSEREDSPLPHNSHDHKLLNTHDHKLLNTHDHKLLNTHDHKLLDPHIWMSPRLVKIQAANILDALLTVLPRHEAEFRRNYHDFMHDLESLNVKIRAALAPVKGETIFVYHPVFGYFAREYGLKQIAVEQGGKAPKGKELVKFIIKARKNRVHVIFVQSQFDRNTAEKMAAAIQGVVIPLDPLARDYINNLENMALTIKEVLSR